MKGSVLKDLCVQQPRAAAECLAFITEYGWDGAPASEGVQWVPLNEI